MHDPSKLPVNWYAIKRDGMTRIMIEIGSDPPFEVMSWRSDLPMRPEIPMPRAHGEAVMDVIIDPTPKDRK